MCTAYACMKWIKDLTHEIHDNEEDFMVQCWKNGKFHHEHAELMSFYLSDEWCQITLLFKDGVTALDTVATSDVLAWYARRGSKLAIIGEDVVTDDNIGNRILAAQPIPKGRWSDKNGLGNNNQKSEPKRHFSPDSLAEKPKYSPRKPVDPKDAPPMDVTDPRVLAYVTERLEKLRPSKKDGALNSIRSIFQFQKGIRDEDRDAMLIELVKGGYIFMSHHGVVSYKL